MLLRSKFGERIGSPPIITIRFYPQTWVSPTLSMLKTLLIVMIQPGTWRNLINTSFLLILFQIEQIPLINTNNTDEPMWMFESNGIHTVSSGYQAIQSWKRNSTTSPSTNSKDTTLWKKLWATHTIPRHKMIFWRILNNFLPLRSDVTPSLII